MRLRHVLASISLTAPLSSCCLREEIWHERDVTLSEPSERMMTLLASCDAEQNCLPVCSEDWNEWGADEVDFTGEIRNCEVTKNLSNGTYRIKYEGLEICAAGRRPAGYARTACAAPTKAGAFLAEQAALEAASVHAFAELRADLVAHGAPRSLLRACSEAAADEVRHARACARLARMHRARVHAPAVARAQRRTLRELAIDNAVEGCVRETYGAVVAGYQARAAADPAIRVAMTAIARDEAKHAQLAWRLQRWLAPRLTRAERQEARERAHAARAELHAAAAATDAELARIVGMPSALTTQYMLDELARAVWRSA